MVMITLPPTIIDTSMTLVLAIKNSNTVVVGVDTLRQKRCENGSYETLYDAKKLWEITNNCVILLAGRDFSFDRIDQFILDFTDSVNELSLTSASDIAKQFERKIQKTDAKLSNLEFVIAGYDDTKPMVYSMDSAQGFMLMTCLNGYAFAGKKAEAQEIIAKLPTISKMNTKELKETVQTILCRVHFECPSEVGGDLRVKVL